MHHERLLRWSLSCRNRGRDFGLGRLLLLRRSCGCGDCAEELLLALVPVLRSVEYALARRLVENLQRRW
jgi:hypothetical protein